MSSLKKQLFIILIAALPFSAHSMKKEIIKNIIDAGDCLKPNENAILQESKDFFELSANKENKIIASTTQDPIEIITSDTTPATYFNDDMSLTLITTQNYQDFTKNLSFLKKRENSSTLKLLNKEVVPYYAFDFTFAPSSKKLAGKYNEFIHCEKYFHNGVLIIWSITEKGLSEKITYQQKDDLGYGLALTGKNDNFLVYGSKLHGTSQEEVRILDTETNTLIYRLVGISGPIYKLLVTDKQIGTLSTAVKNTITSYRKCIWENPVNRPTLKDRLFELKKNNAFIDLVFK